ncbi:MAG: NADH-quinone oxidoreductase subunit A [Candidatus Zixiibacteriota bacterium]
MFEELYPLLFLLALATFLAVALTVLSVLFGRRTRLGRKTQPYECGIDPVGTTRDPVPVKYFMVAISFILFDIEIVFLMPWAVVARDLGMFGFTAITVFVLLILVGYFYELGKGALRWD